MDRQAFKQRMQNLKSYRKNIVEPVDPSTGNFTVPIEEFDIWRKAKIGWLRDQKVQNRKLNKMSDSDPIKKMSKQHKNINAYTKWFNAIPLLGTTTLGANAYFNNNKNE